MQKLNAPHVLPMLKILDKDKEVPMRRFLFTLALFSAVFVMIIAAGSGRAAQDRFALQEPNGISFGEIKGYESWPVVAPSYRTDKKEVRIILGNDRIIQAFRDGLPENGKPFPDGSILVKVGYSERKHAAFPAALEPDVLQRVEFMIKDAKRFKNTNGWGYARFLYDAAADSFTPYGKDAAFDQECNGCHTLVKARDYVFTGYSKR